MPIFARPIPQAQAASSATAMSRRLAVGAIGLLAMTSLVRPAAAEEIRIGYQKSSTLTAILKTNGALEKALAPLGITVSWHEFTSGLPLLEAINVGSIDFGADVADTVPIFAQAAGAKLAYVAEEAASPSAQAILVPKDSAIKAPADLKGKKVAVTKGAGSHFLLLAVLAKAGLSFKDITPAYLTPADGRAAFVSGNVDVWVAWDPFLSSAQRQSGARILTDGSGGLASYKRYYLASAAFAEKRTDALNVIFARLVETGTWVKANPNVAAALLAGLWGIDAATVEEANSHRSYKVGVVTPAGLSEQQRIADTFTSEGLLPRKVDTGDVKIWAPKGS
ncbi:aliphatic sulfonate ABC transporter substrate-binding protein [Bradyrhizobium pachyrhizi]|uniref:Putative aliphatic sulfonates-binding protein n=1 Tax=Bradyrhizobium pachyrhizi TaxID=280333 RepID=A0A844S9T7_9BRAD|nr:aliphatic sulfonate ABC transporter substrate-binding protein [Bradyrhizobium pachyrhizi]MVT63848.1 aliphatic sulfonate ABC transporter substrate-binding protein [Bradyrhizobium pachyrhizi]